jgi:serine/threonine protein kinase
VSLAIGRYRVSAVLAEGAMTRTVLVENTVDTVSGGALHIGKRLQPRMARDPEARRQLDTEARVLRALAGRGAPRLLDRGTDDHGPWLVMERLPMHTMRARNAVVTGDRAAFVNRIAASMFHALHVVHEAEDFGGPLAVVHADLSPDNVLVGETDSRVVLIDFGLAHYRDEPAPPARGLRGTPQFIAPEVARGEAASVRSDLFSLALGLLHAACDEPPRTGGQLASLILQAAEEPVTRYAERASRGLTAEVRDALIAAIAFDPERRPASAREAWRRGSW